VPDDHVLFSLDVNLDNVLNLTRKDTIIRYFKECVDLEVALTYGEVAAWLIARTKGEAIYVITWDIARTTTATAASCFSVRGRFRRSNIWHLACVLTTSN
jgi:hypothetical protein